MFKNLHQLSLHVVNLAGNQNQKMQVMSAEPITANQHHKPTNHAPKKSSPAQPQKSHTTQRICS
jgi:hypothetical protein